MRCALASKGFINGNIEYNRNVIISTLKACSGNADIVIFGETFLQGFDGLSFNIDQDEQIAVSRDDSSIKEICNCAQKYSIAVSFGFIEKAEDCLYSSQITIDSNGNIIDVYRRVSEGWKEPFACARYREGDGFNAFSYQGKRIVVGLCGDLWYDENITLVNKLEPDVVFWPVYTDFNPAEWNTSIKFEYAEQAGKMNCPVLYINSVCIDKIEIAEAAKGGSALFVNNTIVSEAPAGDEAILTVEV